MSDPRNNAIQFNDRERTEREVDSDPEAISEGRSAIEELTSGEETRLERTDAATAEEHLDLVAPPPDTTIDDSEALADEAPLTVEPVAADPHDYSPFGPAKKSVLP